MPCSRGSSRQRPHDDACSSRAPKPAREHPGPGRPIQLAAESAMDESAPSCRAPMAPSDPRSTVLTPVEEAMIVEFRRRTLLPVGAALGHFAERAAPISR